MITCARGLPQHKPGCRCVVLPGGGEATIELSAPSSPVGPAYRAWVLDRSGNKVLADLDHNVFREGTFLMIDVEGLETNERVRVDYEESDTIKVSALVEVDLEMGIREELIRQRWVVLDDDGAYETDPAYQACIDDADAWVADRNEYGFLDSYMARENVGERLDVAPPSGFFHATYAKSTVIPRKYGLDMAITIAEAIRGKNPSRDEEFFPRMFESFD